MSICKTCGNTKCRDKQSPNEVTVFCAGYIKLPTNADCIRAMSDMGIAKLFTQAVANGCPPNMDWDCRKDDGGWEACDKCWCKWLQQPAEEV